MGKKTEIAHLKGEAFQPLGTGIKFIGSICGISGAWKGKFMKALAEKWPEAQDGFERWKFYTNPFIFGNKKPWPVLHGGFSDYIEVGTDTFVVHMAAQDVPVPETPFQDQSLTYLEECLRKVSIKAMMCKASFHIQKSVFGFGPSVSWDDIEKLIEKYLSNNGLRVIVYSNPIYLEDKDDNPQGSYSEFGSELLASLPSFSDAMSRVITKICYKTGNLTFPEGPGTKVIAHICRFDGVWKTTVGSEISKVWPEVHQQYHLWYSDPQRPKGFAWLPKEMASQLFNMGNVQLIEVKPDIFIANMVAHRGRKTENGAKLISYSALAECLGRVGEYARENNATVHIPRQDDLKDYVWEEVKKLIEENLCKHGVEVTVYSAPTKQCDKPSAGKDM